MTAIDLDTLVSVGSLIGVIVVVYKTYKMREAAMRAEGASIQQQASLVSELGIAKSRITDLETKLRDTDLGYAGIRSDVNHILTTLNRIESKLDGHISSDISQ